MTGSFDLILIEVPNCAFIINRMNDFLINEANKSQVATFLFAHGAGAPMDSPFMNHFAESLAERGIRVVRFEFPYMAARRIDGKKRGPGRAEKFSVDFSQAVNEIDSEDQLFIGGKSMGGRVATLVADEPKIDGIICLGYPFHPPGNPDKTRTAHLADIGVRTLIVQGERDSLGSKADVANYNLSEKIELVWLPDGDHSFKPRKASGETLISNYEKAIDAITQFIKS